MACKLGREDVKTGNEEENMRAAFSFVMSRLSVQLASVGYLKTFRRCLIWHLNQDMQSRALVPDTTSSLLVCGTLEIVKERLFFS